MKSFRPNVPLICAPSTRRPRVTGRPAVSPATEGRMDATSKVGAAWAESPIGTARVRKRRVRDILFAEGNEDETIEVPFFAHETAPHTDSAPAATRPAANYSDRGGRGPGSRRGGGD